MIYSYDIFDTCLIRTCGRPSLVFDILAKKILGDKAERAALADFAMIRSDGERKAREVLTDNTKEEVTINEIYDFCDFSALTGISNKEIMHQEMQIEQSVLVPCLKIKSEIDRLHHEHEDVVFISDMYLPEDFIKKILVKEGLYANGDKVFVSSASGKRKATGSLYKYVREKLNGNFSEWHHKGDNKYSDVDVPKRLGIHAKLVNNSSSHYEALMSDYDFSGYSNELETMSGLMRAMRLMFPDSPRYRFAADFIAPIYTSYIYSVMNDAQKRGIRHLYFIARDGYILLKIAEQLTSLFPNIDLHYLYASRRSLYLPGLREITTDEICDMLTWHEQYDINELMDFLQVYDESVSDKCKGLKGRKAIDTALSDERYRNLVIKRRIEQRELCTRYFDQEGLSNSNSAIVDTIGTRNSQVAINRIFSAAGKSEVFGYYFVVVPERNTEDRNYWAAYYLDRYYRKGKGLPIEPPDILEQYFSIIPHRRTAYYKKDESGEIVPVFEEDPIRIEYKQKVSDINIRVCQSFARKSTSLNLGDWNTLLYTTAKVYYDFYITPRKDYLEALSGFEMSDNRFASQPLLIKAHPISLFFKRVSYYWYRAQIMHNTHRPKVWLIIFKLMNLVHSLMR